MRYQKCESISRVPTNTIDHAWQCREGNAAEGLNIEKCKTQQCRASVNYMYLEETARTRTRNIKSDADRNKAPGGPVKQEVCRKEKERPGRS